MMKMCHIRLVELYVTQPKRFYLANCHAMDLGLFIINNIILSNKKISQRIMFLTTDKNFYNLADRIIIPNNKFFK